MTGGIVTVNDSKWQMSFTVNRQQQFKSQPEDEGERLDLCIILKHKRGLHP